MFGSRFLRGQRVGVPWLLALLLGVCAVGLGVAITLKPFASLGALIVLVAIGFLLAGLQEIGSAEDRAGRIAGVAWIVGAVAVVAWPSLSITGVAIVVGVTLIVGGVLRLLGVLRGEADGRLSSALSGLTRLVFGVLALSWPDISLLVVSLLVGPSLIVIGGQEVAHAIRRRHARGADDVVAHRSRSPRWLRTIGSAVGLLLGLALLVLSAKINENSPQPDSFYDVKASQLAGDPGELIRSESFTRGIPDGANAWRILYTTRDAKGKPAAASALIVEADNDSRDRRPVVAWAHGTTGYDSKCAPSRLKEPFVAGAMPGLDAALDEGWAVVAADYIGLGPGGSHPYLIGKPEAHSVLDAIRAAQQFDAVELDDDKVVVWGHSQGGGAALWTGIEAPNYAPDVHLAGVAALAPATRLPQIFDAVRDEPVGKIMGSYVISAYADTYDDVKKRDYIRPAARQIVERTAHRCLSGPEALVSVAANAGLPAIFSARPSEGALGRRLLENVPTGSIAAPLMIQQGLADTLVLPTEQSIFVNDWKSEGQDVDYRTYDGYDHVGIVLDPKSPAVPDLIEWTTERFAG